MYLVLHSEIEDCLVISGGISELDGITYYLCD